MTQETSSETFAVRTAAEQFALFREYFLKREYSRYRVEMPDIELPPDIKTTEQLIVVPPRITCGMVLAIMEKHGQVAVQTRHVNQIKPDDMRGGPKEWYIASTKPSEVCDVRNRGISLASVRSRPSKPRVITLLERLILGDFYHWSQWKHLDRNTFTICEFNGVRNHAAWVTWSSQNQRTEVHVKSLHTHSHVGGVRTVRGLAVLG